MYYNKFLKLLYPFSKISLLLLIFLLVQTKSNGNVSYSDTTSYLKKIETLDNSIKKLKSNNYKLKHQLNSFIKNHNAFAHSTQYKADSIFGELLIMKDIINTNKNDIEKADKSIKSLTIDNIFIQSKVKNTKNIVQITLIIIYLLTITLFLIARFQFIKTKKETKDKFDVSIKTYTKKLDNLKSILEKEINEKNSELSEKAEKTTKELIKEQKEQKELFESRFRNLDDLINTKF